MSGGSKAGGSTQVCVVSRLSSACPPPWGACHVEYGCLIQSAFQINNEFSVYVYPMHDLGHDFTRNYSLFTWNSN